MLSGGTCEGGKEVGEERVRIQAKPWPQFDLSWRLYYTPGIQGGSKLPWTLSGQARGLIPGTQRQSSNQSLEGYSSQGLEDEHREPALGSKGIWVEHQLCLLEPAYQLTGDNEKGQRG